MSDLELEIVPGPVDRELAFARERTARFALVKDVASMLVLSVSGTVLALTGHESTAGVVLGGLLAMLVPSTGRTQRAMFVIVGAAMGAAFGELS